MFELWQREAYRIGAVVLALSLFMLASTLVLAREIGRRAEAERKLEEMATTDALTGLKNRRKFDQVIDVEWRRAMRQKTPVALLMIDADHFKAYNDTFGHQAGDQVLVGIAICISDSVSRAGDCAARYGGEEFAVLLPNTSATDAFNVAETIRAKVQGWSDDQAMLDGVLRYREPRSHHRHGLAAAGRRRRQGALCGESRRPQPVGGREPAEAVAGGVRGPVRHCERSEGQSETVSAEAAWIASSLRSSQ